MTSIDEILDRSRTVAVVGMSSDLGKPAGSVPAWLREIGYHVIPVNPRTDVVQGLVAYADLTSVAEPVDIVDVFRPADEAPTIAAKAVAIGAKALWLQLGITSPEARAIAEAGGLDVVEDRCMRIETRRRRGLPG